MECVAAEAWVARETGAMRGAARIRHAFVALLILCGRKSLAAETHIADCGACVFSKRTTPDNNIALVRSGSCTADCTGRLDLSQQGLTAISEGVFDGLSGVTELVLAENSLSSLPSGVFGDLSSLEHLELQDNAITALPSDVFAGLSTLVTVALSGNTLSTLPAGVFADLGALTSLEISDNSLTRLDAGSFAGLARLSALLLDHNSIVDVHQSALAQLRALQVRRLQRSIDAASPLTPALILVIAAQPKSRFCRGSI